MEFAIVHFLNELGRTAIDPFTDLVCKIPFLIALWSASGAAASWFDRRNGRRVAVMLIVALALHFLVSEAILKHAVLTFAPMRVRPYLAAPDEIFSVGTRFTDSSFPSSHAASTAAELAVLVHAYR